MFQRFYIFTKIIAVFCSVHVKDSSLKSLLGGLFSAGIRLFPLRSHGAHAKPFMETFFYIRGVKLISAHDFHSHHPLDTEHNGTAPFDGLVLAH